VVQVTALLNAEKAKEIHEQIRAAGIKSYTEVVTTAKGDVTRVRAGPFATRAEAEKARSQLHTLGLDGKVTAR
jgi:DedD protein